MDAYIYNEANAMYDELVRWRRDLHKIPELGLELPQTAAYVMDRLKEFNIPFETKVHGNCIVAYLGKGDRCLLLRADMDGLPVHEETALAFASQNGCMHACGHDLHTASLLGAAKILKAHENELKGTIKLLFQPGEEICAGARAAIKDNVLNNPKVDAAFATHVSSGCPVGMLAYGTITNAAVYGFKILITGKGTHGAMPENGIDPINVGVHIYLGLQELIARECASGKEVTLTIGQFNSGAANNIIPETAVLQGTLRTLDDQTRSYLIQRIHEIVHDLSKAFRARGEVETLIDIPAVCCDEQRTEQLAHTFETMDKNLKIIPGLHITGSEDFAVFSREVPASFFLIGAQDDSETIYAHHNPKVCFNEKALPIGTAVYACAALDFQ